MKILVRNKMHEELNWAIESHVPSPVIKPQLNTQERRPCTVSGQRSRAGPAGVGVGCCPSAILGGTMISLGVLLVS